MIHMKPGAALNRKVAEALHKAVRTVTPEDGLVPLNDGYGAGFAIPGEYIEDDGALKPVPDYSGDWRLMGALLEGLEGCGRWQMGQERNGFTYWAECSGTTVGGAESPPHAVALLYLMCAAECGF